MKIDRQYRVTLRSGYACAAIEFPILAMVSGTVWAGVIAAG